MVGTRSICGAHLSSASNCLPAAAHCFPRHPWQKSRPAGLGSGYQRCFVLSAAHKKHIDVISHRRCVVETVGGAALGINGVQSAQHVT